MNVLLFLGHALFAERACCNNEREQKLRRTLQEERTLEAQELAVSQLQHVSGLFYSKVQTSRPGEYFMHG